MSDEKKSSNKVSHTFWGKKWGKDKICAISHTRMRPGVDKEGVPYVFTLNCKHRYYRKALKEWVLAARNINTNPTCPLCRKYLSNSEIFHILTNI